MKNKPLPIQNWGLDKKTQKRVEKELMKWYNMFVAQADGKTGTVYRSDFINDDIFFFTNCQDIDGIEQEDNINANLRIRSRKQKVLLQLLILNLLGKAPHIDAKCSHCGGEVYVDAIDSGHFYFCKKCGKIDCSTYLHLSENYVEKVKAYLEIKGLIKREKHYYRKMECPKCKKISVVDTFYDKCFCTYCSNVLIDVKVKNDTN